MKTSARVLNILIRVCGSGALALGLSFWLGYARSFIRLHIWLGVGLVLALWALAAIAWMTTARRGLAAFAIAWGLATWAFGVTQSQMLAGSIHWIVEVAHLAMAAVAIAVGVRLASTLTSG